MRKHILFKYFPKATGANGNMISAPISITLRPFDKTTPRLNVLHDITEIYTHTTAHKIIEIRSPIAGLLQNRTGKEEQPEVPK
jgi:hypothetical protein